MEKYSFYDLIWDFISVIFFGSLGVTVMGQFTSLLILQLIGGIGFIVVMRTTQDQWGPIDLLLIRRLALFVVWQL